ncbi:hypothetical protein D3C85_459870 [compost metagenome]
MAEQYLQYAPQILAILTRQACAKEPITYGDIAEEIGIARKGNHMVNVMNSALSRLFFWCQHNGLPHLTSLAVRTTERVPGVGFWGLIGNRGLTLPDQRAFLRVIQQEVYRYYDPVSRIGTQAILPFIESIQYDFGEAHGANVCECRVHFPGGSAARRIVYVTPDRNRAMTDALEETLEFVVKSISHSTATTLEAASFNKLRTLVMGDVA